MATDIKCGNCGARNPLTSIFCIDCGQKIDFSKVKRSDIDDSGGTGFFGSILKLVRLGISLAIIGGAGLCLWPQAPTGQEGDAVARKEGRMKMARLFDAADNGLKFTGGVAENEINAYLAHLLEENRGNAVEGGSADLDLVNVDIGEESVAVTAVAALSALKVSYRLEGVPVAGDAGFEFDVSKAELGHLPLPGPGRTWLEGRMMSIFAGMEPERKVLSEADAFKLKDDTLWIKMQGH